jgi:hypothetical protein
MKRRMASTSQCHRHCSNTTADSSAPSCNRLPELVYKRKKEYQVNSFLRLQTAPYSESLTPEKSRKTDKPPVPLQSMLLHSHSHAHSLNLLLLSIRRIHSHFHFKLHNPHPPLTLTLHLRTHSNNLTEISPH